MRTLFLIISLFCSSSALSAGWYEGASIVGNDLRVWGWGCDKKIPNQPVWIHVWRDDNVFLGAGYAGNHREPAVGVACGGNSVHGFYFQMVVPDSLLDYKEHQVYAYVVSDYSPSEKLGPPQKLTFSGNDTSNPPRNWGDVMGRDYLGPYIGHIGIWDGDKVIQMTGSNSPSMSLETKGQFNTYSKPWGAINLKFPTGLAVKRCFSTSCLYTDTLNQNSTLQAARAAAARAYQIYLIGADYTVGQSFIRADNGYESRSNFGSTYKWPPRRGTYRCDTLVFDALSQTVASIANPSGGIEVFNAPSNWGDKIWNMWYGSAFNIMPKDKYDSIKKVLGS